MSTASLTPFSYVILVLVGEGGAGPHDLVRMMRQGAWAYWTSSQSQYYAEPKRLERLGYLTASKRPGPRVALSSPSSARRLGSA